MKKVVKFGGSSLASARQFKKVGDFIRSEKSRRYVVPSAPGKRNDKDEKVISVTMRRPREKAIRRFWRRLRAVTWRSSTDSI